MTIHLSILLFWPLLLAVLAALAPRAVAPVFALFGALVPLGYAVILLVDFDPGAAGCSTSPTTRGSTSSGIRYSLGVDGLNLWLVALTALLFAASALWIALRAARARAAVLRSTSASPRRRCWARSWRRTWRCSSSSST